MGDLGEYPWGLDISKDDRYAFVATRDGLARRFTLSNMAAGGELIGSSGWGFSSLKLHPSDTKLYWSGSTQVFECDTVPGGAGCTTLKDASGAPLNLAIYGSPAYGIGFFFSPSDPDRLWITPHTSSFGYFDLAAKTNHIIANDLSPVVAGLGLTMSADEAKMFVGGHGGVIEWTFATNSKRTLFTGSAYHVNLWPDVNGKKVLWSGGYGGGTPVLLCYENCNQVPEVVATLPGQRPNENSAVWNRKGDKFYNLKVMKLYRYDGVGCK